MEKRRGWYLNWFKFCHGKCLMALYVFQQTCDITYSWSLRYQGQQSNRVSMLFVILLMMTMKTTTTMTTATTAMAMMTTTAMTMMTMTMMMTMTLTTTMMMTTMTMGWLSRNIVVILDHLVEQFSCSSYFVSIFFSSVYFEDPSFDPDFVFKASVLPNVT